jgi:hypothetical protein
MLLCKHGTYRRATRSRCWHRKMSRLQYSAGPAKHGWPHAHAATIRMGPLQLHARRYMWSTCISGRRRAAQGIGASSATKCHQWLPMAAVDPAMLPMWEAAAPPDSDAASAPSFAAIIPASDDAILRASAAWACAEVATVCLVSRCILCSNMAVTCCCSTADDVWK